MQKAPLEWTKITVYREETATTIMRSNISGFQQPIFACVHGGVQQYYGVEPEVDYPSALDYVVTTAGG